MTDASTARPVLSGRYELHRRIARGGMADVFLARDQLLDRPVAVKVLFPQYAAEPTFVARFRREAQAAANLNHPSVVAVYDWGSHEDTYFIVMEYVEGRSLADVLASEGHLHPDRAAEVATDVAAALGFAHRNGTVHRDVKPGNIMITPAGQVKVTDFGIARAFGGGDDELTQTGSVMGTASYFSPEQAQGKPVDPRSDLYSLGVVLFEMVTGEPPFNGASPVSIAYKHVQEAPPTASSLNPSVPPPLDAIINRLLAKNPDQRYAAAEDVRADLRRFREGHPLVGSAASQPAGFPPPQASNGAAATTAMARPDFSQGRSEASQARRPLDTGSSRAIIDTTRAVPASAAVRQIEPVEEYYEPPSRTGVFLIMLAGLLVLLIGLIFYISQAIAPGDSSEEPDVELVAVPSLIGDRQTTAQNRLTDAGLEFVVELQESDEEPNIVFDQDPDGRTEVEPGSTVTIYVSKADELVAVPNVVGQPREEAVARLDAAGFLTNTNRESSDDVPLDSVISQSPEANAEVNAGSEVEIVVSTGPEQQTIPPLTGLSASEATTMLQSLGFVPPSITQQASSEVPPQNVIETRPPAGSVVALTTTIELIVSTGGGDAQVPPVKGLAQGAAEIQLAQAGFRARVELVGVAADSGNVGNVVSQSPEGNQNAPMGSEVVIRVGQVNENENTTTTNQENNDDDDDG